MEKERVRGLPTSRKINSKAFLYCLFPGMQDL